MTSYDNRASTAGYVPQDVPSTGYVACQEKDMYPAEPYPGEPYPGSSTDTGYTADVIKQEPSLEPTFVTLESADITKLVSKEDKPNDYKELTIVACIFNFLFGMVAMALSFKSREKWEAGNRRMAKSYGIGSMLISVLAIVTTAVMVFVLVYFLVLM